MIEKVASYNEYGEILVEDEEGFAASYIKDRWVEGIQFTFHELLNSLTYIDDEDLRNFYWFQAKKALN